MDFITWLFYKHYLLSSFLMPGMSSLYGVYEGNVLRFLLCLVLWVVYDLAKE